MTVYQTGQLIKQTFKKLQPTHEQVIKDIENSFGFTIIWKNYIRAYNDYRKRDKLNNQV